MRNPRYYTREILALALSRFCRGKVIDVGCGRGKYQRLICQYCDSYIGIDNRSSDYQFAPDRSDVGPDVLASVLEMPFLDDQFDTAICTEVIEHLPNPFHLVREISRVLKPGGYMLLSSGWIAAYHQEPLDYWRFSLDAYNELCETNGMRIVGSHSKGGLFTVILYLVNRNIELNTRSLRKIHSRLRPLMILFELLTEQLDRLVTTQDTIGHLVVAQKPRPSVVEFDHESLHP